MNKIWLGASKYLDFSLYTPTYGPDHTIRIKLLFLVASIPENHNTAVEPKATLKTKADPITGRYIHCQSGESSGVADMAWRRACRQLEFQWRRHKYPRNKNGGVKQTMSRWVFLVDYNDVGNVKCFTPV